MRPPLLILLVAALIASAFGLVTGQHRARGLFVDLERAQLKGQQLEAEGNRLQIELARAAQPASIEAAARELGLRPIDAAHTVFLPAAPPSRAGTAGTAGATGAAGTAGSGAGSGSAK